MSAQLRHLIELAKLPHVTTAVMPFSRGGHSAAGGSFSVSLGSLTGPADIVYISSSPVPCIWISPRKSTGIARS